MTLHDHWLVCPLSLLWKLDREPCEAPQCVRCTLHAGRPPQLWRTTARLRTAVEGVDALICPSASTADIHRRRGVTAPMVELPHLLPEDWATPVATDPSPPRPYLVAAGRLVREKGFEDLIRLMARMPEIDLRIAGEGPLRQPLSDLAAPLPNVELVGPLTPDRLAGLFAGALALVAPSLFYETFGYVVLEAASVGTPAIVRRRGALPEVVERLEAGFVFDTDDDLAAAVRKLVSDPQLRRDLGERARAGAAREGNEQLHVDRYLELVEACGSAARRPSAAGDRSLRLSPA
jgi:glycosyltransferase involved in cell wall biosynthesis